MMSLPKKMMTEHISERGKAMDKPADKVFNEHFSLPDTNRDMDTWIPEAQRDRHSPYTGKII